MCSQQIYNSSCEHHAVHSVPLTAREVIVKEQFKQDKILGSPAACTSEEDMTGSQPFKCKVKGMFLILASWSMTTSY